ncbi:7835_t:CDS:2 [Ambispora gerdemannii]|uniref:7835_t:CDS:1 n=1 Tax=Ambispora gerdemannii TaxID=144530 RepID=A0A9N9H3Y5_9GLOM|nr:7835_t:CDS:2 [Ambispora gerdemannii]
MVKTQFPKINKTSSKTSKLTPDKKNLDLDRDTDYQKIFSAYENNYSEVESLPDSQVLAEEMAYEYLFLVMKNKIKKTKKVKKSVKTKTPAKSRPVPAKSNTLAYYGCLIDQIANPDNQKAKITQLAHHCKCNKGKVAQAQQEHKQKLLKEVATNYKKFGQSLGHYLQADIVGCLKDKK